MTLRLKLVDAALALEVVSPVVTALLLVFDNVLAQA